VSYSNYGNPGWLSLTSFRFRWCIGAFISTQAIERICSSTMTVIVELKSAETLSPIHTAQMLTYLKLSRKPVGLLINFNVPVLKDGVKRILNPDMAKSSDTGRPEAPSTEIPLSFSKE
jgi:hypothetical protein